MAGSDRPLSPNSELSRRLQHCGISIHAEGPVVINFCGPREENNSASAGGYRPEAITSSIPSTVEAATSPRPQGPAATPANTWPQHDTLGLAGPCDGLRLLREADRGFVSVEVGWRYYVVTRHQLVNRVGIYWGPHPLTFQRVLQGTGRTTLFGSGCEVRRVESIAAARTNWNQRRGLRPTLPVEAPLFLAY